MSRIRCPVAGGNTRSAASPCAPRPVVMISRNWTNRSNSGPSHARMASSLRSVSGPDSVVLIVRLFCPGTTMLQRLTPREARVEVVPVRDRVLLRLDPAEVDLLVAAERREVDQAPVEVAEHDVHGIQLRGRAAQVEEGLRDRAAGVAAAVRGPGLGQRLAHLLVVEPLARVAHPLEPLGHPGHGRAGLLEGVVAGV